MTIDLQKKRAAERAVSYVENHMVVGLGTGSTVRFALERLAAEIDGGLKIVGVPTSKATEQLAHSLGIPLIQDFGSITRIDLAIDGADEVDENLNLIKGGGGALTREKIVAFLSDRTIIIVDEKKKKPRLGGFPVPVEILPFAWTATRENCLRLGPEHAQLRSGENGKPVVTDNGNFILDCKFAGLDEPAKTELALNAIPGVIENGIFTALCDLLIVGCANGECREFFAGIADS